MQPPCTDPVVQVSRKHLLLTDAEAQIDFNAQAFRFGMACTLTQLT